MAFPADSHIAVFTKPPTPGLVKTRLVPALGAHGAAALHEYLLVRTLHMVASADASASLWVAGNPADAALRACTDDFALPAHRQTGADLGGRMALALRASLGAHRRVLLIGSDCPALTAAHLREAAARLDCDTPAVFIPAEDGGYVLVGVHAPACTHLDVLLRAAFDDIPWSTEDVMRFTRERLSAKRIRWAELPPLWDVDRPEDLARLRGTLR
ncbi:TIGR04282 family arsenosugar biosynthesis glycosyltransferase [Pandoraea sp.]|uniref:TIGR04282 family arsenosugar biosynthesis glycosyltransferase n=1 Tax=Pandoraea sp. TaxID=1883445 RepID=UPI00121621AD|nr:TIGR04282 family arsenosugar biosynthesis glycosyltransferase [Pandoraea sp.]TAL53313.1 MAG: glycosyltransferase [Pandoraea sp.]TAM20253.1 MAG: glycosyltransferase [Pandoraea sp.]